MEKNVSDIYSLIKLEFLSCHSGRPGVAELQHTNTGDLSLPPEKCLSD